MTRMRRKSRQGRFARSLALVVSLCLALAPLLRAELAAGPEHKIKAAFLYNFAKFVEWPTDSTSISDTSFVICILGQDPLGAALKELARDQQVRGCRITLREIVDTSQLTRCDILVVPESRKPSMPAIAERTRDWATLLVGDWAEATEQGGMIGLYTAANKVRFRLCPDRINHAGLKVSSRLLKFAYISCGDD